jgi:hemerythrin-like domain-containing protein
MSNIASENDTAAEQMSNPETETKILAEACPAPTDEKLLKLSAEEFRVYNSMATHMDAFHNHFRSTWNMLYSACTNNKRPSSMSLKQFVNAGIQFCNHLSTHHAIEEQHIFPMLATRMPEFKQGKNAAELLRQHKEIHAGLDGFEEYLKKCRDGETELDLRTLKAKMDTWGHVLWKHLDQEVKTLGAENMRKYWSLNEMRRMPL